MRVSLVASLALALAVVACGGKTGAGGDEGAGGGAQCPSASAPKQGEACAASLEGVQCTLSNGNACCPEQATAACRDGAWQISVPTGGACERPTSCPPDTPIDGAACDPCQTPDVCDYTAPGCRGANIRAKCATSPGGGGTWSIAASTCSLSGAPR